jgi:uncharacterized protein (TIGR00369 family)
MPIVGSGVRINAHDVKSLADFYKAAVGLKMVIAGEDFAVFDDGTGTLIEIGGDTGAYSEAGADQSRVGLNLVVDSLEQFAGQSDRLPLTTIIDQGYRRSSTVVDPEGNVVQLVEPTVDLAHKLAQQPEAGTSRPFLDHLGLRWELLESETVVELDLREDLQGPGGALQGGVTVTLIDVAAATRANIALAGARVFTSNMTVQFLRQGRAGPIRAAATLVRSSRTGAVVEVRVIDVGDDGELIAVALVQMQIRDPAADA